MRVQLDVGCRYEGSFSNGHGVVWFAGFPRYFPKSFHLLFEVLVLDELGHVLEVLHTFALVEQLGEVKVSDAFYDVIAS